MFYLCLCYHVTSWCSRGSNKQNEIKLSGPAKRSTDPLQFPTLPYCSPDLLTPIPPVRPTDLNKPDRPPTSFTLPLLPCWGCKNTLHTPTPHPFQTPSKTKSQKVKICAQSKCTIIPTLTMTTKNLKCQMHTKIAQFFSAILMHIVLFSHSWK